MSKSNQNAVKREFEVLFRPSRRTIGDPDRLRILAEVDQARATGGKVNEILSREGILSSQLTEWGRRLSGNGKVANAPMLKAIQAQESKEAAKEKAEKVIAKLVDMWLRAAAQTLKEGIDESLIYMAFPRNHWTRIRTNNALERMNREIRRRTRVVGNIPDGRSALMLVSARLRHVAATQWGSRRYLDMDKLQNQNPRKEALEVVGAG